MTLLLFPKENKMKNKKLIFQAVLFWLWQLTWGALITIPGLIISGICILLGGKIHRNGYSFIVEIGQNWGGVSLGAVSLCGNYSTTSPKSFEHVRRHEFGHSVQQLIFGPLQLFLVGIPSGARYWYSRLSKKGLKQNYDYVWFEYTASKWGTSWINKIENKDFPYTYKRIKK